MSNDISLFPQGSSSFVGGSGGRKSPAQIRVETQGLNPMNVGSVTSSGEEAGTTSQFTTTGGGKWKPIPKNAIYAARYSGIPLDFTGVTTYTYVNSTASYNDTEMARFSTGENLLRIVDQNNSNSLIIENSVLSALPTLRCNRTECEMPLTDRGPYDERLQWRWISGPSVSPHSGQTTDASSQTNPGRPAPKVANFLGGNATSLMEGSGFESPVRVQQGGAKCRKISTSNHGDRRHCQRGSSGVL
jgi:hypothetical protein